MEVIGFWISFFGWLIILGCAIAPTINAERLMHWAEESLHVPWYVQIFTPCVGIMLLIVGWHLMCLGGGGRYPGYPLDVLIKWMK